MLRSAPPPGDTNALKHGYCARPSARRRVAPGDAGTDLAEALVPSRVEGHVPSGVEGWSIETVIINLSIKRALLSRCIHAHLDDFTTEQPGMLRIHPLIKTQCFLEEIDDAAW